MHLLYVLAKYLSSVGLQSSTSSSSWRRYSNAETRTSNYHSGATWYIINYASTWRSVSSSKSYCCPHHRPNWDKHFWSNNCPPNGYWHSWNASGSRRNVRRYASNSARPVWKSHNRSTRGINDVPDHGKLLKTFLVIKLKGFDRDIYMGYILVDVSQYCR